MATLEAPVTGNTGTSVKPNTKCAVPEPLLPAETQQQIAARCGEMMHGAMSSLCVYLGHELGLYKALQSLGPTSAQQLAAAASVSERWVQEWLYQQSSARLVCCDQEARSFWLSDAQVQVLVEPETFQEARESPLEMVLKMPVVLSKHERLLECFKTGVGLSFDDTGIEHCQMHRHARALQVEQRMRMLSGLVEKLQEGVKVADVGCGSGEILMHLATLFPASSFVGYDISKRALSSAEERKAARGITNVTFLNPADGPDSGLPGKPTFHVIVTFDAIHDMTDPMMILKLIRQSLLPDSTTTSSNGTDSAVQPTAIPAEQQQQMQQQQKQQQQLPDALSTYKGGPVFLVTDIKSTGDAASNIASMPSAPFLYGVSIGICMSSATSEPGGAGLGTVGWHEDKAREMSAAAGFSSFSKLDFEVEGDMGWHAHYMIRP